MASIFRKEIRCNLGILQVSAQYGDEVPSKTEFIHLMIYEKFKRKDVPKSDKSVLTAMV
jgi:hypothetical protein